MLPVFTALRSSVGKKILMAMTAFSLVLFVVVHLLGNLKLLSRNSNAFNIYAHKMMSLGGLLYVAEIGLLLLFLTHIIIAGLIFIGKRNARPVGYYMNKRLCKPGYNFIGSTTMIYTGAMILIFLVVHLMHFKFGPGIKDGYIKEVDGKSVRDLHRLVVEGFQSFWYVSFYTAVISLLGIHLSHGFWSAFQSLGINHPRYTPLILGVGILIAITLSLGFISLPVLLYFIG
ncbi:MAG: succinate dehydrogenase cytochrome b subunit [Candidatus Scalindua sp.]|nr:succinate dehydrogenase cytochrome b subunit [Candidatus Scalindua sp.]